jgi:hypothetical protein
MQTYKDSVKGREPFSEDYVDAMAKTPGMEGPVDAYRKGVKDNPAAAKRILLQQYATAHTANVRGTSQSTKLPAGAVTRYKDYIEKLDLNKFQWDEPSTYYGRGIPEEMKLPLAVKMAQAERDEKDFEPTPDRVKAMLGELKEEKGKENAQNATLTLEERRAEWTKQNPPEAVASTAQRYGISEAEVRRKLNYPTE